MTGRRKGIELVKRFDSFRRSVWFWRRLCDIRHVFIRQGIW